MQTLSQFQDLFYKYLAENQFDKYPRELYEPVRYILNLGGKRMRPLLALMAHSVFSDDFEKSMPDIMDEAPLRRGKPTIHEHFSVNHAILSGDVMLIYAYEYLRYVEKKELLGELLALFNKTAIEVCEGQQNDMNFETRDDVSLDEYLKMIEFKTAVLLGCSLEMGARIGGGSPEDAKHLYEFGRNVGLAFQMQDDLLDTYGDPEKFGKKVGGDIIQNKKTYLVLRALELGGEDDKNELNALMQTVTKTEAEENVKIEKVRAIFNRLEVKKYAEELKNEYQKTAFDHLAAVNAADERKEILKVTAEGLLVREV